jgi:hypothetical protein
MLTEVIDKVKFVLDTEGNKIEEDATKELLKIPGIVDAIEQSKQRMQSGKFVRYENIKRNV